MNDKTIRVKLDFMGKPFIVEACDSDGTIDGSLQSTKEFLWEEITNIGLEDTLYGFNFEDDCLYEVSVDGGWDYEHVEYDYDINYKKVDEDDTSRS